MCEKGDVSPCVSMYAVGVPSRAQPELGKLRGFRSADECNIREVIAKIIASCGSCDRCLGLIRSLTE